MSWFEKCYSRILVDNHISEFHPLFMSEFDPSTYCALMKKAGVDASMIYASDHNGNCYYRTEVGHMHHGLSGRDIFGETIDRLIEHNIVPLAYHSVIYFNQAAKVHPAWRMQLHGGVEHHGRYWYCCPNNNEYRGFCKKQLQEILSYPVEGIFIDMVFWPGICLCHNCKERYFLETGKEIPAVVDWDNSTWVKFQRTRERWMGEFAEFLTAACNEANPSVSVTQQFSPVLHGWGFGQSPMIPNACEYASGDFYGGRFHQSLALKAMDVFSAKKPYEFFTSRCVNLRDHTTMKSKEQMKCSAAATLANGGAFVLIDAINPDGTMCDEVYQRMGEVTADLKPFLDTVKKYRPILTADVGLYFSMPSHVDHRDNGKCPGSEQSNMTSSTELQPIKELLAVSTMLCRAHIPYKLIRSDDPSLKGIKTLIINNCAYMSEEELKTIREFVERGGVLIATGCTSLYSLNGETNGCFGLADVFGVTFTGEFSERINYLGYKGVLDTAPTKNDCGNQQYVAACIPAPLVKLETAISLADVHETWAEPDNPDKYASIHSNPPGPSSGFPAMTLNKFGKGKCVYIPSNIMAQQNYAHRTFSHSILKLYGKTATVVSTNAPDCIEITLLKCTDGSFLVAFVNCQEQLPNVPARNVSIDVKLPNSSSPQKCTAVSDGRDFRFKWKDNVVIFEVDEIDTIEMVHITW